MPLGEPPQAAGSLAGVAPCPTVGVTVHRVWRHDLPDGTVRTEPWWFTSVPSDPDAGGRFDLPAPMGTCYTADSAVGAALEALQCHLVALPVDELRVRRRIDVVAPGGTPDAADLTAPGTAGTYGITAALWAGDGRPLTQRWAAALRRDGWWVLHHGLQHDPSGRLRGYTMFDHAGAHPPTYGQSWRDSGPRTLHDDPALRAELSDYGVVVRDVADLPEQEWPQR